MDELIKIERRPVPNYEGIYEVSLDGEIHSIPRQGSKGGILKFKPDKFGYLRVGLCKGNKTKTFKSHRIVAQVFIPNPDNLPHVNHRDGNKQNNHVSNLEWMTARDNIRHSWKNGMSKALIGEMNGNSKISDSDRFNLVVEYATTSATQHEIAFKYGITQSNVALIVRATLRNLILSKHLALDATKIEKV